jgi:predicted phosphodiesterase
MKNYWSSQELNFLKSHLHLNSTQCYQQYLLNFGPHRSLKAIKRQRLRLQEKQNNPGHQSQEAHTQRPVVASRPMSTPLGMHLREPIKHKNPTSKEDREDFDSFVDRLIELSSSEITNYRRQPISGRSSLVIVLSDTHIGKLTPIFNAEVFKERILSIPQKIIDEHVGNDTVEEIVIALVGDMLEGEGIYETQAHHIEMVAIDQVQIAIDTLWQLAINLKQTFDLPVRFITAPGNHGRVSKTASEKTNWDNVIYQTLGYLGNAIKDDDITAEVNFKPFEVFQVQDKKVMLYHHGTKHLGTASMQNKVGGWLKTKGYDLSIHGHWHHWETNTHFGVPVIKNGSLCGADDLSEQMGVYDPPRQAWCIITKDQPISKFGYFQWQETEVDD